MTIPKPRRIAGAAFARPIAKPRRMRSRSVFPIHGVCFHTTGRGVLKHADPLRWVTECYYGVKGPNRIPNPCAHYVISGAELVQVVDELQISYHAGIDAAEHVLYESGAWRSRVSPRGLELWWREFPQAQSPLDLFPVRSPNACYLSIEVIPESDGTFSAASYGTAAKLVADIWERHHLPDYDGQWLGPPTLGHWDMLRRWGRIVGHEDLEPLARWDKRGGWDPGACRPDPRWSWARLFALMEEARGGTTDE